MKLIAGATAAAAAVAEALTAAEFDVLDEAALPAAEGFPEPDRTEAAAGCCWLRGKMKAGAC